MSLTFHLLSEGQYIYPGSKWKVRDIRTTNNDEVEFYNEDTREKLILKGGKYYVPEEAPEVEKEIPPIKIEGLIYRDKVSDKFGEKVIEISKELNIDPNFLMAI